MSRHVAVLLALVCPAPVHAGDSGLNPASSAGPSAAIDFELWGGGWSEQRRDSRTFQGAISGIWFSHPLADDGTPLSLQPFLQRASSIGISAIAGAYSTSDPTWPGTATSQWAGFSLAVDRYLTPELALTGEAGVESQAFGSPIPGTATPGLVLPWLSAGAGLRIQDTRVDLAWRFSPVVSGGAIDARAPGFFSLSLQSVIGQQLLLAGSVRTRASGGGAAASFNYYLTPRFQLGGELAFRRERPASPGSSVADHWVPGADASYWTSRRVKLLARYRQDRVTSSGSAIVLTVHEVKLELVVLVD
jgi:hypothetical protein